MARLYSVEDLSGDKFLDYAGFWYLSNIPLRITLDEWNAMLDDGWPPLDGPKIFAHPLFTLRQFLAWSPGLDYHELLVVVLRDSLCNPSIKPKQFVPIKRDRYRARKKCLEYLVSKGCVEIIEKTKDPS